MEQRLIRRTYMPYPHYQPVFDACLRSDGCNARLAWWWTALSAAIPAGDTFVRTSCRRLATLADGNRRTVSSQLDTLQEANLAVVDEVKGYTSFRLRLRIGPHGPFYEGGKDYGDSELGFFQAPHVLIGDYTHLIPEAKVLWCWGCSLPEFNMDEEPTRLRRLRRPFGFSYYKECRAVEQMKRDRFLVLEDRENSLHTYITFSPLSIDAVREKRRWPDVRTEDGAAALKTG